MFVIRAADCVNYLRVPRPVVGRVSPITTPRWSDTSPTFFDSTVEASKAFANTLEYWSANEVFADKLAILQMATIEAVEWRVKGKENNDD